MLGAALLAVAASLSGAATASAQSDEHPKPTLTVVLKVDGPAPEGTTYSMRVDCSPRHTTFYTLDGPGERTLEITQLSGCGLTSFANAEGVSAAFTCETTGDPTCSSDRWAEFPADPGYTYLLPGTATITVTHTFADPPSTTSAPSPRAEQPPITTAATVEESTTTSSTTSSTTSTTTSTTRASDSELAAAQRDRGGSSGSSPWPIALVVMAAIAATAAVTWQVRRRRDHLPNE
jgi:hypothetical protein